RQRLQRLRSPTPRNIRRRSQEESATFEASAYFASTSPHFAQRSSRCEAITFSARKSRWCTPDCTIQIGRTCASIRYSNVPCEWLHAKKGEDWLKLGRLLAYREPDSNLNQ